MNDEDSCTSIHKNLSKELIQEQGRVSIRSGIGKEPVYIKPKKIGTQIFFSQEEFNSEGQFNQSIMPKFYQPSTQLNKENFKPFELISQNQSLQQDHSNKQKQSEISSIWTLIVWIAYLLGSVQTDSNQISRWHIIDILGNVFAMFIVGKAIYNCKKLTIQHIFHILSIISTITFLSYQAGADGTTFINIVAIIRSLRLLFPIFVMYSFFQVFYILGNFFKKIKKIVFAIFILLTILSFLTFQMYSTALHNQCRDSDIPTNSNWMTIGEKRLCGSRNCPLNSFCRNPQQLQMSLEAKQVTTQYLSYGFYRFNNFFQSMFTNFQLVSLNNWSRISLIFFDTYSPWVGSLIFVIFSILIQILLVMLIVVFFDQNEQIKNKQVSAQYKNKKQQKVAKAQKDSCQAGDIKNSKKIGESMDKNKSCLANQIGSNAHLLSRRSLKIAQEQENKKETPFDVDQQKQPSKVNGKKQISFFKIIGSIFAIIGVISHIALAFSFGLQDKNLASDYKNRLIGIILCVIYIIQTFALGLTYFQFSISEQQAQSQQIQIHQGNVSTQTLIEKQVTSSIVNLQIIIWVSLTLDYIARILQNKYLMQARSVLTPFAHFTLCLRLYYIYIIFGRLLNRQIFLNQLLILSRIFKLVLKYVTILLCVSCTLGVLNFNINNEDINTETVNLPNLYRLVLQINRFFMFFVNHSWSNLLFFGGKLYTNTALNLIFTVVCSILGQFICIKFIFGSIIQKTRDQCSYLHENAHKQTSQKNHQILHTTKNLAHKKQYSKTYKDIHQQEPTDQETHLKKQKSFFLFSYQNCLRSFALDTIRNQYFKDVIRFRFYIVYVVMAVFGVLSLDLMSYRIMAAILEIFVLFDIVLHMIALRVFGEYSYINKKVTPVIFILTMIFIYITIFCLVLIQALPGFQITRIFVVLAYFQSISKTLQFLKQSVNLFSRNLILLCPIVIGIAIMIFPNQFKNGSQQFVFDNLINSFKYSTIFIMEKGWNFKQILNISSLATGQAQFMIFFINIIQVAFSSCIIYSLVGILLSKLKTNLQTQQKRIAQTLFDQKILEEQKIRKYILSIDPQFEDKLYQSKGFLAEICTSKVFSFSQIACSVGAIISFLFLNADMSISSRVILYSFHLFFLTFQIGLFLVKSISYGQNQKNFVRDLILIIIAIPGAYIGFVPPVNYSSSPADLTPVLMFFNILTVFRFFKILDKIVFFKQIVRFINQKTNNFQNIILIFGWISLALSYFHYLLFHQKIGILQSINNTIGGVLGADFYHSITTLQSIYNIQQSIKLQILLISIHITHLIFKNLMIAYAIFQISDYGKENVSLNNTQYTLFNFKKYLHQQKLLEQWIKIDPKGTGIANYKDILFKSHRFFQCFSVSNIPYKSIQSRIQNFKELGLSVYQLQYDIQSQQDQKPFVHKEYVITFYDFLYMISRLIFQQMKYSRLINKKTHFTFNQYYVRQPPSMININSTQKHLLQVSSEKDFKQKYRIYLQQWKKESSQKVRQRLKIFDQCHPQLSNASCFLRPTSLKTTQLYNAFKMIHKIKRFQLKIQKKEDNSLSNGN